MRKQTQECLSTGFTNAEVRLDALWSIQPHSWNKFHRGKQNCLPLLFFLVTNAYYRSAFAFPAVNALLLL